MKELYDRNGDVKINKENKVSSYDYNSEYREWVQDDTNIISSMHYDGEKEHLLRKTHLIPKFIWRFDKFYTEDANEDKRNQKMVNFVELIADTMIGDLKNNIIYVSGDDNSSTYEMNLDAIQSLKLRMQAYPQCFQKTSLTLMMTVIRTSAWNRSDC